MKPKRKKPIRAQVRVINSTAIRLRDWRISPELVLYAQRLMNSPEFQTVLAVLRNESPSSYGLGIGATHDDQIAHAYKATGYNMAVNTLEAMASREEIREPIEATFSPELHNPKLTNARNT